MLNCSFSELSALIDAVAARRADPDAINTWASECFGDIIAQKQLDIVQECVRYVWKDASEALAGDEPVTAVRRIEALIRLCLAMELPEAAAGFHRELGRRFGELRWWGRAAEALRHALLLIGESQPEEGLRIRSELISFLRRDRRFDEAIEEIESQKRQSQPLHLCPFTIDALVEQSLTLHQAGRDGALIAAEEAVTLARMWPSITPGQPRCDLAFVLRNLGIIARLKSNASLSRQALIEALELERVSENKSNEALTLSELGLTADAAGDRPEAARLLRLATDLVPNDPRAARWLSLATLWSGNPADIPLPLDTGKTDPENINHTGLSLLRWLFARINTSDRPAGDAPRQAEALARTLLNRCLRGRHVDLEPSMRQCLSLAALLRGDFRTAVQQCWRIIALEQRQQRSVEGWKARYLLVQVLRAKGSPDTDFVLQNAIIVGLQALRDAGSAYDRQTIADDLARLYGLFAELASGSDEWDLLVERTEMSRGRNIRDWIEAVDAARVAGLDEAQEQALSDLRAAEVEYDAVLSSGTADALTIQRLNHRRSATRHQLQTLIPGYDGFRSPLAAPLAFPNLAGKLASWTASSTAVIYLYASREGVSVAVSAPGKVSRAFTGKFLPWKRDDRLAELRRWFDVQALTHYPDWILDRQEMVFDEAAHALFEPCLEMIEATRAHDLLIVPHGELALLPMWGLVDRVPIARSFSIVPSLGVLGILGERGREKFGPLLTVGDATGTLGQTEAEIEEVQRLLGLPMSRAATIADLRQRSSDAVLLHIAAHGRFVATNPWFSGLSLAADGPDTGPFARWETNTGDLIDTYQEGCMRRFTVAEAMSDLALPKCRLAVLAACESGLSRLHGAEEMTGLPTAFLLAGAKSVVASLWKVDDSATAILMRAFYHHYKEGASPSHSLSAARRDLRSTTRQQVLSLLQLPDDDDTVPSVKFPYARPIYSDAFACYGTP
jgi:CHAT domain-containing protein/tetratricopeptide (TPR) repeat protein